MTAYFIISLDTELNWGYNLNQEHLMYKLLKNPEKGIKSIKTFLNLLNENQIKATWAIVGALFYENYHDVIENIVSSETDHEIGYHSFSHVRFNECNEKTAKYELEKAKQIENDFDMNFQSFVFPENKIGHVNLLKDYGFNIYRGPNLPGQYRDRGIPIRTLNFIYTRFISPPVNASINEEIWELPSSMVFNDPLVPQSLIFRTKVGILESIRQNKIFNLFLHPEDLLLEPNLNYKLEKVLKFVRNKEEKGKIKVITMGELPEILSKSRDII